MHDQIKSFFFKKKKRKQELYQFHSKFIRWRGTYSNKIIESSDGTYVQHDSDGDTYCKAISLAECLKEMKTHFIDIIF